MSVFMICERTLRLIGGSRLNLSAQDRASLEALDYEKLVASKAQKEAADCALQFAAVRDRMLAANPWVFARASVMLAALTATIEGWPYAFALPGDCLNILALVRRGHMGDRLVEKWERVGSAVGCLYPVAEMRYTRRAEDTDDWDPLFTDAFCYSLAAVLSAPVIGEAASGQGMEQTAMMKIEEARRCGAIQKPLSIPTERYGFHGFSDRFDSRYSDEERWG